MGMSRVFSILSCCILLILPEVSIEAAFKTRISYLLDELISFSKGLVFQHIDLKELITFSPEKLG